MDVHVSWSLAGLNRTAEAASRTNQTEDVAKAGEARDAAEAELEAWFSANGGKYLSGGEPGRATFVLDHLEDFRQVLDRLRQTYGAVAAGIGVDSKEADQALQVSQTRGSRAEVVWSPDHADEIRKSLLEDFLADLPATGGPEALEKKISGISPGTLTEPDTYDYSHVLPQHHREGGYSMSVVHLPWKDEEEPGSTHFDTVLHHRGQEVGSVSSRVRDGALHIDNTTINGKLDPSGAFAHRGKRLGVSMYAATMAHSHHLLGAKRTLGGVHSTSASRTHQSLARDHGLDYRPTKVDDNPVGDKDGNYGPYEYALKSELTKAEQTPRDVPAATPEQPPTPTVPQTFEQQFHAAAQAQERTDRTRAEQGDLERGQLLGQVAQVLRTVQQQAPKLEQLRQAAPEVYQAVKAMAQAVAQMAQGLRGDGEAMRKAEEWLARPPLVKKQDSSREPMGPDDYELTPEHVQRDVAHWVDNADGGHHNFDWVYHENFPVAKLKPHREGTGPISDDSPEGWKKWLVRENAASIDERGEDPDVDQGAWGEDFGYWWENGVNREPVVVTQRPYGFAVEDGNHRTAVSHARGMTHVPAVVGYRKLGKSEPLDKNLAAIPPGKPLPQAPSSGVKEFDYSHLLPANQRHMKLFVRDHGLAVGRKTDSHPHYTAHVSDSSGEAGSAQAHLYDGFLGRRHMEMHAPFGLIREHQGKGLGSAMYEALQAHGVQHGRVTHVTGGGHTDAAGKVHERLASRHGFRYRPKKGTEYNDRGPYKYAVKAMVEQFDLVKGRSVEVDTDVFYEKMEKALRDVLDAGLTARPVKVGKPVEKRGRWMGDRPPEMSEPSDQFHDYSHLLSERHRGAGFKLVVRTPGNAAWQTREDGGDQLHLPWGNPNAQGTVSALLVRRGKVMGHVHVHNYRGLAQPHSQLAASLQGQGLGSAMYEAALAHSVRYAGSIETMGSPSEKAGAVHNRLAELHDLKNVDGSPVRDAEHGYNYRLVPRSLPPTPSELATDRARRWLVRKSELVKAFAGLPIPKPRRRVNLRLPVGTWDATTGRIKIRKPDGSEVWHQAKVGLIASSSPATAGADFGNPTSARNPSG